MLEGDELAQKRGIVIVDYCVGFRKVDPKLLDTFRNIGMLTEALPVRTVAVHFCYDISQIRPLALFIQNALALDFRLRFRTHYGTP